MLADLVCHLGFEAADSRFLLAVAKPGLDGCDSVFRAFPILLGLLHEATIERAELIDAGSERTHGHAIGHTFVRVNALQGARLSTDRIARPLDARRSRTDHRGTS